MARDAQVWRRSCGVIACTLAREAAVFYPEDDEYFVDRETTVSHFEVAAAQAG